MAKVPDVFGMGAEFPENAGGLRGGGTFIPPSDNGQVMWRHMGDMSPSLRQKHHNYWDKRNQKGEGKP